MNDRPIITYRLVIPLPHATGTNPGCIKVQMGPNGQPGRSGGYGVTWISEYLTLETWMTVRKPIFFNRLHAMR